MPSGTTFGISHSTARASIDDVARRRSSRLRARLLRRRAGAGVGAALPRRTSSRNVAAVSVARCRPRSCFSTQRTAPSTWPRTSSTLRGGTHRSLAASAIGRISSTPSPCRAGCRLIEKMNGRRPGLRIGSPWSDDARARVAALPARAAAAPRRAPGRARGAAPPGRRTGRRGRTRAASRRRSARRRPTRRRRCRRSRTCPAAHPSGARR